MSPLVIDALYLRLAFGLPLACLLVGVVLVLPIGLGLQAAQQRGVSRAWMWLSLALPLGAWAAYLGILMVRRTVCVGCGNRVPHGVDLCPVCCTPMAVTHAAADERSRTRWALWTGRILCPACQKFVGPNTDECPRCGVRLPRIRCPVCGGHDTQLVHRPRVFRLAAMVMIAMAAGLYAIARNTYPAHPTQAGVVFVISIYLALGALAIVLFLVHSPWARSLFCRPCYYSRHKFHRLNPRQIVWYEPDPEQEEEAEARGEPDLAPPGLAAEYRLPPSVHCPPAAAQ
jgi:hypothetical protein